MVRVSGILRSKFINGHVILPLENCRSTTWLQTRIFFYISFCVASRQGFFIFNTSFFFDFCSAPVIFFFFFWLSVLLSLGIKWILLRPLKICWKVRVVHNGFPARHIVDISIFRFFMSLKWILKALGFGYPLHIRVLLPWWGWRFLASLASMNWNNGMSFTLTHSTFFFFTNRL